MSTAFAVHSDMPRRIGTKKFLPLRRSLRVSRTRSEQILWRHLRANRFFNLKFRRQHGIGPYIVDFYCAEENLVIEIAGDIHAESNQIIKDKKTGNLLEKVEPQGLPLLQQ